MAGMYEVGSYPEDVERNLQELIEEINEYKGEDVLIVASFLHACFERFDMDSDLQPLKDFIIKQQEKTWTR